MRDVTSCHISCCRLDWQRPFGEDLVHPDQIVECQRYVVNLTLGESRLHRRLVLDRDSFWGDDVTKMNGELVSMQRLIGWLEDVRDQGRGPSSEVSLQQLRHEWDALQQNNHY